MAKTQTDFLISLAYLLGEKTVNATTTAPRADFIQSVLEDAYGAYPWRFARVNATLSISNGIATLPTDYDDNHGSYAKFNNGSDVRLDQIDSDDSGQVNDGDRAQWIETINGDRFQLITKDSDVTGVLFRYQKQAPVLNSAGSITTPYPNKKTIALGARTLVKLGQNPDADISQDDAQFDKALTQDIARHQVPAPRTRRRTAQSQTGRATGDE